MASVRTRKRGKTYSYVFEAGKTADGKRKVIEKGGFATKESAYLAGVKAYADFKHGNIGITSEQITVKELLDTWLKNVVSANVKKSTYINYDSILKNRVVPFLGQILLQELSPTHIDNLFRTLLDKGLSYGSIQQAKVVFGLALSYAVYPAQLIPNNPAHHVKIPKQAKRNCVPRVIVAQDVLDKVIADNPTYRIPLLLLYCTGMRIGEVLGLTWECITGCSIKVVEQFNTNSQSITAPKTKTSVREIPISSELVGILDEWHKHQLACEKRLGSSYIYQYETNTGEILSYSKVFKVDNTLTKKDFVCTRDNGKLILYNAIRVLLKNNGLNAHSFRHTHATLLIENGASPKGVAARLGHTSIDITQNLYTHVTDKMKQDTLAAFDTVFRADKRPLQTKCRHFFPFFFI